MDLLLNLKRKTKINATFKSSVGKIMCKVALLRRLLLLFVTLASLESCTDDSSSQISFDMATEADGRLPIPETYMNEDLSMQEVANDFGGMERDFAPIPDDYGQLPDQYLMANIDMTKPSEYLDLGIDMSPPYEEGAWSPHDLSGVNAYAIPNSAKIFAARHPAYRSLPYYSRYSYGCNLKHLDTSTCRYLPH